ncbi:hypothetical protein Tco_0223621 [Tanacetum coccineum]
MESLSSNSEEKELQQMQFEERQLYSQCMAWFKELKIHREFLHNNRSRNENKSSDHESTSSGNDSNADIGPSYDNDTVSEVHCDMFENVFAHKIQNHEQPESIPDTYVVKENNNDIISNVPNLDQVRDKEEHDDVMMNNNVPYLLP